MRTFSPDDEENTAPAARPSPAELLPAAQASPPDEQCPSPYSGDGHHKWVQFSKEDATCTQDGKIHYVCSYCERDYFETLPALGHSMGPWQTVRAATCTQAGLEERNLLSVIEDESSQVGCVAS